MLLHMLLITSLPLHGVALFPLSLCLQKPPLALPNNTPQAPHRLRPTPPLPLPSTLPRGEARVVSEPHAGRGHQSWEGAKQELVNVQLGEQVVSRESTVRMQYEQ